MEPIKRKEIALTENMDGLKVGGEDFQKDKELKPIYMSYGHQMVM